MQRALTLYQSTIGKKVAMALSGLVIIGFAVGHMLGNLNAYLGEQAFNAYAASIKGLPPLLWGTRLVLLVSFSLHIGSAFVLWNRNRDARPSRYHMTQTGATTPAAQSMIYSGMALALFIGFHLLHFTIAPQLFNAAHADNPYWNFYVGMSHPVTAAIYAVGNIALGFHVYHGFFSAFQSLGANHPKYNHLRRDGAMVLATALTLANLMFPVSGLIGAFEEPQGLDAQPSYQVAHGDEAH